MLNYFFMFIICRFVIPTTTGDWLISGWNCSAFLPYSTTTCDIIIIVWKTKCIWIKDIGVVESGNSERLPTGEVDLGRNIGEPVTIVCQQTKQGVGPFTIVHQHSGGGGNNWLFTIAGHDTDKHLTVPRPWNTNHAAVAF